MDKKSVAIVTGAGAGIGRAIALALADRSVAVVVSDISEETGSAVVGEIAANGGRASFQAADVSSPEDQQQLVDHAVQTFGKLDLAVNNAGLGAPPNVLADVDVMAFDRAIAVTLRGTFLGMRAQLQHMDAHGGGAIVNIASIGGLAPSPMLASYNAAKHGVVALTRSVALEYAGHGIRINGVAPGPIETDAFATLPPQRREEEENNVPVKRLGQPEEVAEATVWLLSEASAYVVGAILPVDGGSVLT